MSKLEIHLEDSLKVDGNIIDFRVYDGFIFSKILKITEDSNKKCYGLDTFAGLDVPSPIDDKNPYPNEIKKGQYNSFREFALRNVSNQTNKNFTIIKTNNYGDLETIIPSDEKFCFAIVDMKQYFPTKKVLSYLWGRMSYGSTIYITNHAYNATHSAHVAVKEFLDEHDVEINISRQMVVNGIVEKFIAIKCYPLHSKPKNLINIKPKKEKITIAMVLRTGGEVYNKNYVNALAKSLKQNITVDHEIVCLTNDSTGFSKNIDRTIPLIHDWPTWWGKIELFKPDQFSTDSVFYLDLDTIIIDNVDDIVSYDGDFCGLRDFYALHSLGSGVMGWKPKKCEYIYTNFIKKSRDIISSYKAGDQKWIDENKPSIEYLQDIYCNQIISYKRHCVKPNGLIEIPKNAKIICFHGNPRPHTVNDPSISKYWQP